MCRVQPPERILHGALGDLPDHDRQVLATAKCDGKAGQCSSGQWPSAPSPHRNHGRNPTDPATLAIRDELPW